MTTEALAEPEVVEAEAPPQEQPPIDPGDAATPAADAGSTPDAPAADNSAQVDAIVQELMQKESEQAQPEPARQEPQVDPEVIRQADEARNRYQANHKTRHDAIDAEHEAAVERLVGEGYSKVVAETLVAPLTKAAHDKLNEHHADSLKDAGYVSAYEQNRAFWQGVEAGVPKEHHEAIASKLGEGKYSSYRDAVSDLWSMAKADGKAEAVADVDARKEMYIQQGVKAGLAHRDRTADLASDGQQVNGSGNSGGRYYSQMTADERNKLTPAQRDAEVARERQARGG